MIQIDESSIDGIFSVVDEIAKILNGGVGIEGRPRTVAGIADALVYVRVLARYTTFDLESTTRERDMLKEILNGNGET